MSHIGLEIKKRRKQLGMTQQEIVEGFMSISKLSNIENGKTDIDPQTWEFLKVKLGIDEQFSDKKVSTETVDKLISQAQSYYQAKLVDKSIKRLEEAIQLSEKTLLFYKTAYAYRELARIYMEQREYQMSIKLLERAIELFESSKDIEMIQQCKINIGVIYYKQEKYSMAIRQFLSLLSEVPEKKKGTIYFNLASGYFKLNDFNNANYACEKALEYLTPDDNYEFLLGTLILQAILLYRVKMYLMAKDKLNAAKELAIKHGNLQYLGKIWHNLGDIELSTQNYEQALEHFSISLEIKERIGDSIGIVRTKSVLSKLHLEMDNIELAMSIGAEALQLSRKLHLKSEELLCLTTLTKVYALQREEHKFLDASFKAIHLCDELDLQPVKLELYEDISLYFYRNHNHNRCMDYLFKAFKVRHHIREL